MSSLFQAVREFTLPDAFKIPTVAKERMSRGRQEMLRDATKRRLCVRFERGETYWFLDRRNALVQQSTVSFQGGKPPHRIRNQYNYLRPIIDGKVSAATTKTPGYEVLPTGVEPDRVDAAHMSERIARYGFDKWNLRDIRVDAVKGALVQGEAFAMPYFDPNVGPYHVVADAEGNPMTVGEGEVCVRIYGGNEVYWEPGVRFEESRWWATEQAVPVDVIAKMPGYYGGKLTPDATSSEVPMDTRPAGNLVMVVEYYERPSVTNPRGRKITSANGRVIVPPGDYPLVNGNGEVLDEPCIHRLTWEHELDYRRPLGLVWQLVDFQRTAQDCINKMLEYKNRGMNPRMLAPVGSLLRRPDDEPGGIDWYRPVGGQVPQWEQPIRMPPELFQLFELVKSDMQDVGFDFNISAGPHIAAATVEAVIAQALSRWDDFLEELAGWDSKVMRHCLLLVATHYTEDRLITVRGRYGPEPIEGFRGIQLLDQQDVTVSKTSLQVKSKDEIAQTVLGYADRGWIPPEQAMMAIQNGTADRLTESLELDEARINRIIQRIRVGTVLEMPPRSQMNPLTGQPDVDPATGQPMDMPGWMPDDQDNPVVWENVLSDWMKTDEYERLDPVNQEIARQILAGIRAMQAQKAMRQAALQTQMAESLGMANAAKPQGATSMPSMPSPGGDISGQSAQGQ